MRKKPLLAFIVLLVLLFSCSCGSGINSRRYVLNVSIEGEGTISPNSNSFKEGTLVTFSVYPAEGWYHSGWGGTNGSDLVEKEGRWTLLMDGHKDISIIFTNVDGLTGSLSFIHRWPNPYMVNDQSLPKAKKNVGKLPLLQYVKDRAQVMEQDDYVKGELIVGFKKNYLCAEEEMDLLNNLGYKVLKDLRAINAYLVEAHEVIDDLSLKYEINKLSQNIPHVAYVEPNYLASACSYIRLPNDAHYNYQWHYPQIRLPQAWQVTTGSPSIRIALLDTGIDTTHPDLGESIDASSGKNFTEAGDSARVNTNYLDDNGHGSHCAGTIASDTNNEIGVAGVMWEASIIPVKVLDAVGNGAYGWIIEGILYAAGLGTTPLANPAQVISMSLGGKNGSSALKEACDRAKDNGVIIVAASGNSNGPVLYPAAYDSVICVGATDYNYPNVPRRAGYSCFGPQLDVVAPGGDTLIDTDEDRYNDGVLSTSFDSMYGHGYYFFQGTSMACPHVAGLVGLMLSNGIPSSQIRDVLRRTSIDLGTIGFDNEYGYGLVNSYWAVNDVKEIKILVGTRNGNIINAVKEKTVDLHASSYSLVDLPTGDYKVFAWVDVQGTGTIDPGDYLYESALMHFDGGRYNLNLVLEEVMDE